MPRHQLLIVDSRDRLAGTVSEFSLSLRGAVENVHSVRLLYCDIPSPDGDTEPYYYIRMCELGAHVRGAAQGDDATFVVPRTAASGFRTIHAQNSVFPAIVFETPGRTLSSLAVSVRVRGGGSSNLTANWYMVLQICCD